MSSLKFLPVLLFVGVLSHPAGAQYKVGDRLVVIAPTDLGVDGTALQTLGRGQDVRVDLVNGDWLWVKHLSTGWISSQNVRTPAEALAVFNEQIRLNPNDAGAYYACGVTRLDLNDIDLALRAFDESLRLDPEPCAYNGRGNCWQRKGEPDKAIADYTEALRLRPVDAPLILVNRAMVWNAKGEFAKAIVDATEAIRIAPRYLSAYSVRAQALAATKQFDNAVADCEAVRQISSKGLSGYNDVAWLLATSSDAGVRDGKKAVEFATKACELTNWNDGSVLDTLAIAAAEAGDFDGAVKWETKSLEIIADGERNDISSRLDLFKSGQAVRQKTGS